MLFAVAAASLAGPKPGPKEAARFDTEIRRKTTALDSIRLELEKGRRELKELERQEGTQVQRLAKLAANIETGQRYAAGLERKIDSLGGAIAAFEDSLRLASQALRLRQDRMKARLRSMYRAGTAGYAELLLGSKNLADALYRVRYFRDLMTYDRTLVASIDSMRGVVEQRKNALEKRREELVRAKRDKEDERVRLLADQERQAAVLAGVQEKKAAYLAMVKDLEQAQQQLAVIIKQLEKKKAAARVEYERSLQTDFEKRKGTLPWPVAGTLVRGYGRIVHPVYKTVTVNNGIDVATGRSAPVQCVARGKVVYIGQMRGLARFVVVDHLTGYLSIYGQLGDVLVAPELEVQAGTTLGRVADAETGPQLHFEIRKSSEAQNPLDWLEKKE